MTRTSRIRIGALALASFALGALTVAVVAQDYSRLLPSAEQQYANLEALSVTLEEAIATAELATDGVVAGAHIDTVGDAPKAEMIVFGPEAAYQVIINMSDGSILKKTPVAIYPKDATANAINKAKELAGGGIVQSCSISPQGPEPVCIVELYTKESLHRVTVNANSNELISHDQVGGLPGDPVKGEPITTSSGLKYYVLKEGVGEPLGPNVNVMAHYSGWLVDGTKFDSSVDRGEPLPVNTSLGVIPGWLEALKAMKVGEKRKLLIPAHLAYGPQSTPRIPPNALLIFDMEVVSRAE